MNYLVLHSGCFVVNGFLNSLIADLQRGIFLVIPKSLSTIINKCEEQSIESVIKEIDNNSIENFNSYVDFLINEDFGFLTKDVHSFKNSTNVKINIVEYNLICEKSSFILDLPCLLENLNFSAIYVRINDKLNVDRLSQVLDILTINKYLKYVQICADYNENINEEILKEISYKYPILGGINLFSAHKSDKHVFEELTIDYNSNKYLGFINCGLISSKYFSCNHKLFSESQYNNSCLFRKISIDKEGNIKNCPSMSESFGNIRDTTLAEAIEKPGFKKYWDINKDKIHVCKDCEFRYICTDCRAYVEDPDDIFSKPLKCGYNPYTGEWSEWSTNPLKQKVIDYYNSIDLIIS